MPRVLLKRFSADKVYVKVWDKKFKVLKSRHIDSICFESDAHSEDVEKKISSKYENKMKVILDEMENSYEHYDKMHKSLLQKIMILHVLRNPQTRERLILEPWAREFESKLRALSNEDIANIQYDDGMIDRIQKRICNLGITSFYPNTIDRTEYFITGDVPIYAIGNKGFINGQTYFPISGANCLCMFPINGIDSFQSTIEAINFITFYKAERFVIFPAGIFETDHELAEKCHKWEQQIQSFYI